MNWRGLSVTVAAVGLGHLGGCGGEPPAIERRIVAHSLVGCPLGGDPNLVITALGDFGESQSAASTTAKNSGPLGLRRDFLGVELQVLPGWWGIGYADPPTDVDVTLWPSGDGCDATDAQVPASLGGVAMTAYGDGSGLFIAGLDPVDPGSRSAAYAMALSLTTDSMSPIIARFGLPHARAFATATPFGDGVLVAGGIDPTDPTDPTGQHPVKGAFVFSAGSIENATIDLDVDARSHHGATLLATGETLLVGGVGDGGRVLASLVAISPVTHNTRVYNLGTLRQARRDPIVLRLADDRILVASGTDQDNNIVSTLEWFASDGSACVPPACPDVNVALPSRQDMAFVALPAGGALAAGGVDPVMPDDRARDVFWITPEGNAEPLDPLSPQERGAARKFRFAAGSDGSPWAWNGSAWLRFDPWQARFAPPADAPLDGPEDDMPAPVGVDPGLFVWLARERPGLVDSPARVRGFRHGVRGRLTRDAAPLLFADTAHAAPDRRPRPGLIEFDADGLHLTKRITEPAPRVVITDALYGDFDLSAETPAGVLPVLEVGGITVGSGSCSWPTGVTGSSFSVRRRGNALDVGAAGMTRDPCPGPEGRVAIALRAPAFDEAIVRKLVVSRQ